MDAEIAIPDAAQSARVDTRFPPPPSFHVVRAGPPTVMPKVQVNIYIRMKGFPKIERVMSLMLDDFTEASALSRKIAAHDEGGVPPEEQHIIYADGIQLDMTSEKTIGDYIRDAGNSFDMDMPLMLFRERKPLTATILEAAGGPAR